MPAWDHHPCQHLQHWPSSPPHYMNRLIPDSNDTSKSQANTTLQTSCTPVCWSASCHVWHPSVRFGFLLQWYISCPRTATRYALVMVLFTAAMRWCHAMWTQFQAHWHCPRCHNSHTVRLLPDPVSLCHHSLHWLGLHSPCHLHLLYPWCQWLQSHRPQLFLPYQLSQRLPLCLCLWCPV